MTVYWLLPNVNKSPYLWTNYQYYNMNEIDDIGCVSAKLDSNEHQSWDMTSVGLLAGQEIGTVNIYTVCKMEAPDVNAYIYCSAYFGFEGWLSQKSIGGIPYPLYGVKQSTNWTNKHIQNADIGAAILRLCQSGMVGESNQMSFDYARIVMISTNGIPTTVASLNHTYTPATHTARFIRGSSAPCRSGIYSWDMYYSGSWHNGHYVGTDVFIDFVVGNGDEYDCRVRAVNGEFISAGYRYATGHPWTQYWSVTDIDEINGIPYEDIDEINGIPIGDVAEKDGIA